MIMIVIMIIMMMVVMATPTHPIPPSGTKKVYRTTLYFTFIRSEFVRNEPINRSLIKTCVRSQICHVGDFFAEFINRPPLDLTSTDDTYFPLYHHHQSSADF